MMPAPLLAAYVAMLPRIRAEDAMHEATIAQLASGRMARRDAQRLIRMLEQQAGGTAAKKSVPRITDPRKAAAMMGAQFIASPRRPKADA